ncbi:hypothetical protein ACLMJK_008766 [Lecanora helva]
MSRLIHRKNISLPSLDYLHLTKRFGIIAASQLPLHYALALKSWSPIQYLTRLSHEELNPYHRLFGRVITIFFSCHASMYLNFYVQKGLLLKRIRDWDVILGVTAISTALLLNTTALAKIRDWNYRVFFYSHVILSLTLLPVLYLHVSHLRVYILETGFVYILLIIQRNVSQSKAKATITQLPSTNLLSITIPLTGSLANKTYTPGQHIYLGLPSLPQKLRINPFSIANPSPAHDGKIQLVARKLKGTTILLADLANDSKKMETTAPIPLLIEGPYGSSTHFPDRETFDRVLFVAGGVGATFTLPLFLDLLQRIGKGERIPPIQFVWTVRRREDAQWGLQMLKEQLGDELPSEVEIYITAPRHDDNSNDENIELQECEHLLSHPNNENVSTPPSISIKHSRPNFHTLINHVFTSTASPDASVAVLVCGPKGMGARLRREVRPWVLRRGRDVFWHGEEFGW